jgi:hypothetical protein
LSRRPFIGDTFKWHVRVAEAVRVTVANNQPIIDSRHEALVVEAALVLATLVQSDAERPRC